MLRSAFILYSIGRYDVKGKQLLKTLGKNYINSYDGIKSLYWIDWLLP